MEKDQSDAGSPQPGPPARRFRRLRRALRPIQWAVNAAVLLAAVLVWTPAGNAVEDQLIAVDPLSKADYIVVLGGAHCRAVEAADLYRDGWAPKVIVSSRLGDADLLARIAASYGVPEEAIIVDPKAMRTADHPRTLASLPGLDERAHRFLVVTSPLHTSRARACFRRAGFRNVRMRVPNWQEGGQFGPRCQRWGASAGSLPSLVREVLAWGYYKLRGWV